MLENGRNVALDCPVTATAGIINARAWEPRNLTDGYSSQHELLNWTDWLDGLSKSELLQAEARSIRAQLQRHGEISTRRTVTLAIASAIGIALIAAAALLIQRTRAKQQQDTLRTRIARDLHDEIGASLSHLAMHGDMARQQLERSALTPERLEGISASARETLDQMRDIVWLLAPKDSTAKTPGMVAAPACKTCGSGRPRSTPPAKSTAPPARAAPLSIQRRAKSDYQSGTLFSKPPAASAHHAQAGDYCCVPLSFPVPLHLRIRRGAGEERGAFLARKNHSLLGSRDAAAK